ncbi:hypothetical protein Nepgr_020946 [Nepenthes gracilis]|uniref:Uncharacterized protein n=1 Tax=Nepenthes gracilis TaxID=150966 RepID=A0AAD3SXT1_NEPGR|nr:hypothetical protein Nepgr_020946 [Nepenthes gracilis]
MVGLVPASPSRRQRQSPPYMGQIYGILESCHHSGRTVLEDHTALVKALAWCPFGGNLLASVECIALLWSKNEHEPLSSHGFTQNQLILWKYPSMVKMAELTGHTSRVLFMAQSPDGCTVASAAGDETLRFWNVFGTPEAAKPAPKTNPEPFPNVNRIW